MKQKRKINLERRITLTIWISKSLRTIWKTRWRDLRRALSRDQSPQQFQEEKLFNLCRQHFFQHVQLEEAARAGCRLELAIRSFELGPSKWQPSFQQWHTRSNSSGILDSPWPKSAGDDQALEEVALLWPEQSWQRKEATDGFQSGDCSIWRPKRHKVSAA